MAGKLAGNGPFTFYAGLGLERSYAAVAQQFGVSKRAVVKRAQQERWQERVAELDAKARRLTEQRLEESLQAMDERHLKAARAVQGKALEALRGVPLDSAMNAVRALDLAIKQERLIRGEPSERTAVNVEEVIKREYERWMVREDAESDGSEGEPERNHGTGRPPD